MHPSQNIVWTTTARRRCQREEGVALIIAMLVMTLFAALGLAIIMTSSAETAIANNFEASSEGLYVADAALEKTVDDALSITNWNDIIQGIQRSGFVDGPISIDTPANQMQVMGSMPRTLADGRTIDIGELTNIARCGHSAPCSLAELQTRTVDRPWGLNNPYWVPFAFGPANQLLTLGTADPSDPTAQTVNSPYYAVVFVADDPSESDNDPTKDGQSGGLGSTIAVRSEAFGPHGVHRIIEATISRSDSSSLERGYIAQRGEDEQNRRYRKAPVGTPGTILTRMEMSLGAGQYAVQPN
jgi:hypothetical protein